MPRIRTLKPEFWQDEKLAPMDPLTRLVFLGLISMADDAGRLLDNVKSIDGFVFPDTDDSSRDALDTLARVGRIRRYIAESGQKIIQIVNWQKHQKVDKPSKHVLPAPALTEPSREGRESVAESSRSDLGPRTVDLGPTTVESDREAVRDELATLMVILPPEAQRILDTFYEPALSRPARERYRQVAMQLVDALDPKHPGPKIRGGVRVKARSVEHMADVCAAVLRDPPMDRDAAIVFVLKKLLDPPKGPSVTERAKREQAQARQLEDQYRAAAKAAGLAWAEEHPKEYAPILAAVESRYAGRKGAWIAPAREAELVQLCAKEARFPTFDEWRADRHTHAPTHASTP